MHVNSTSSAKLHGAYYQWSLQNDNFFFFKNVYTELFQVNILKEYKSHIHYSFLTV